VRVAGVVGLNAAEDLHHAWALPTPAFAVFLGGDVAPGRYDLSGDFDRAATGLIRSYTVIASVEVSLGSVVVDRNLPLVGRVR